MANLLTDNVINDIVKHEASTLTSSITNEIANVSANKKPTR